MIEDRDILFVTTTLNTKWMGYQKKLVNMFFPESEHLIIDGTKNWPYPWFYWIEAIKETSHKWIVYIDEDCFLSGRKQLVKLIEKMNNETISLSAVSDGYNHYRGANPVAINSFLMICNAEDIRGLNFNLNDVEFTLTQEGWRNSLGIIYNEDIHRKDFSYPHRIMENGENTAYEQEPYYMILWMLKEMGKKFYYLYPHFDDNLKSTNPRIEENSDDIAIHMWYTREWKSYMLVHGIHNIERYSRLQKLLKEKYNF